MNEAAIQVYIKAAFSASFLVSEFDGEITADEVGAFMQALKELHDFDLDEEDAWQSFRDALQLDKEEHLSLVAGAAGLSEELRREIVNIAFAVAVADGEFALNEILCLADIRAALGIETGEGDEDEDEDEDEDQDEDEDEDEADPEIEDEADSEASGKFAVAKLEAEAALKAEGNPSPSADEISLRAIRDMLSDVGKPRSAAGKGLEGLDPDQNPIIAATLDGDTDTVRRLLSAGRSPTDVHFSGTNALILAVREGHLEIVDALLAAGADPERINPATGMTPVRMAIQELRPEIATRLLKSGADPNLPMTLFSDRLTEPLEYICIVSVSNDPRAFDLMDAFLRAGADPNAGGPQTCLRLLGLALESRRPETLELLLKAGADPNVTDPETGLNVLVPAILCASGDTDGKAVRMLDLLLEAGLQQQEVRSEIGTLAPVQMAAMQSDLPAGFLVRLVEYAEKSDLDLALWYACIEGQAESVRDLIRAGADINITVPELDHDPSAVGDCPLNAAATRGYGECVRLLIEAGADVDRNAPPEGGQFPLLMAAESGHAEVVRMLIDAGADVSQVNPENKTHALCGAVRNGHSRIVSRILEAGADPNLRSGPNGRPVINYAVNDGRIDIVRILIKHGADIDAVDSRFGHTALVTAASQGHAAILAVLLKHGADPLKTNPVQGSDALMAAVLAGQVDCVRLLLEAGADPNMSYVASTGKLPLLVLAGDRGNAEIVRLLAEHGADVTSVDGEGMTALQRAGIHRHKEVEAVLVEFGADPSTRLVKFTDTPAGREAQSEILKRMAGNLRDTAGIIRDSGDDQPADDSPAKPES